MPPTRVLVVDDQTDMRVLITLSLGRSDAYEVVGQAADRDEAVALAGEHGPDVILLDYHLASFRPEDVIPALFDAAPDARVFVMSATMPRGEMQRPPGAAGFIDKANLITTAPSDDLFAE